ncbi:putative HTH-type transcriptional regulator [Pseudoruegeria aquimaris]|uniref:Putative HTH-type transcriptional regulator n=1 Tax=Pseudoruegeria aquimaris TaxID=393663 RepID=A0A1Y5TC35_9RHOB|nr:TetR/AcrR family transcriptional regulator [Pseudoruegeria aquimaris]SLN60338.1 putative HTH-type transcriptional regulator [Pseudoruegeria aquimaris]
MPDTRKEKTRARLRSAIVAEAVEKGLSGLTVGGVVARAKVSAGTVYVHFANKDDMLRQCYLELKRAFHEASTTGRDLPDTAAMIRSMWVHMFEWVAAHPLEFLFLEQASLANILTPEQAGEVRLYAEDIAALLRRGVEDGTLAPLDPDVLSLLLTAPAMQLARKAVAQGQAISTDDVDLIFNRVWRAIAA